MNTVTEISVDPANLPVVLGTEDIPDPIDISHLDWSDAAAMEPYESLVVRISGNLPVTNALRIGDEWEVDGVIIDNRPYSLLDFAADFGDPVSLDTTFTSVTGPLWYGYGAYKIAPRDANDFAGYDSGLP